MLRHPLQTQKILNFSPFTGLYSCTIIKLRQTHTDFELSLSFPVMSSDMLGNAAG